MSNFILSAELVLKDKMTAGLKKTGYALSGIAGEALKVTRNTDTMKKSLSGIKGNYQATLSVKDMATSGISKVKSLLSDFKNKDYSSIISVKDRASQPITKVKGELSGLLGKTYTAYVNVKTNMPNGGFNFNNSVGNFTDGMLMGTGMQMAGAAGIGYTAYDTIKTSMDFDYQLSAIKSLIPKEGQDGQSRDEIMSQIRERAMQLGQDTVFGNTDVARGMTELVKAGVQLKDVLGEASEAALNLATAGGLELAEAAETMSTAMNAFKVTDATHAADILAGAANASATDVHELRYSLAACSAVAAGAGVSFEDTNTALAVFAQNGLKGSDAGTSLKTMLSNLIPRTDTQIAAFSKLGLITEKGTSAFFNQKGEVKSLAEIAGILQSKLKGLTKEEQMSTLYDMFGSDAIRGGMILMREGAEGVTEMFEEMSKVTAKEMALTQLDNLKGDIEELSGAWENFQITLMSGSGTSGLRSFTQELTDLVKLGTEGLKDGFGFNDLFTLVGRGITDLTNKFIAFDGIGSVFAGGALLIGLKKIFNITIKIGSKIKEIIEAAKGIPKNLPTDLPNQKNAKDIIINAQNVYVNGKTTSASKPNNNSSTILGPNGKPLPSSRPQPPISKPPAPLSWRERLKGIFSKGLESSKKYSAKLGKLGLGIGIPLGAYSIYNAKEGERGLETARVASSLAGGYVGAKAGSIAGGTVGSIIPGIGTGAGAIIGGVLGGISGSILGSQFADSISRLFDFSADDNIIKRINDSSWGQAQNMSAATNMNISQMQYDGVSTSFNNIAEQSGQAQLQSAQAQMNSQQQMYLGFRDFVSGIWGEITDNVNIAGQMQFESNQIQVEGQKQAFSGLKDFATEIWNGITDTANTAGQMQFESNQMQVEGQKQVFGGLRDFATEIWNGITDTVNTAGQTQIQNAQMQAQVNTEIWNSIQQAGVNAWEGIQNVWNMAVSWFTGTVYNPLANAAQSAGNAIANGINSAISTIQGAWAGVVNWFETNVFGPIRQKYIELKNSAPSPVQSVLSFVDGGIGHNATGTMNWKGGWTEINERGGEIVDLPSGSRIYPAIENITQNDLSTDFNKFPTQPDFPSMPTIEYPQQNTPNMSIDNSTTNTNGGNNNITITGNTFVVRNEQDIDEIAYRLMSLMRQVDANFGGAY